MTIHKPDTNAKAWTAGATTFAAVAMALAGFGEMPADDTIVNAFLGLGAAAAAAAGSAFLTWLKSNR